MNYLTRFGKLLALLLIIGTSVLVGMGAGCASMTDARIAKENQDLKAFNSVILHDMAVLQDRVNQLTIQVEDLISAIEKERGRRLF